VLVLARRCWARVIVGGRPIPCWCTEATVRCLALARGQVACEWRARCGSEGRWPIACKRAPKRWSSRACRVGTEQLAATTIRRIGDVECNKEVESTNAVTGGTRTARRGCVECVRRAGWKRRLWNKCRGAPRSRSRGRHKWKVASSCCCCCLKGRPSPGIR
jgi:hypothetical protein